MAITGGLLQAAGRCFWISEGFLLSLSRWTNNRLLNRRQQQAPNVIGNYKNPET
jgi:hypothetical protein